MRLSTPPAQGAWAVLSLFGARNRREHCWGSVEAELWAGSCQVVLECGTKEGRRKQVCGCWDVLAQGVKLRLEEEKPAGREEPKAGGGG